MKDKTATTLMDIPFVFVLDDIYEVGGRFDIPLLFESYVMNRDTPYVFAPCEDFDLDMAGVSPSVIFDAGRDAAHRFSFADDIFIFDRSTGKVRSGNYHEFTSLLNDINPDLMGELAAYVVEADNPTDDPVLHELVEWWDTEGKIEFAKVGAREVLSSRSEWMDALYEEIGDGDLRPTVTIDAYGLSESGTPYTILIDQYGWELSNGETARIIDSERYYSPVEVNVERFLDTTWPMLLTPKNVMKYYV